MDKKNHNIAYIIGVDTDDMELVNRYGLDPSVAYTPRINAAVRKAVHDETLIDLLEDGYSDSMARSIASQGMDADERREKYIMSDKRLQRKD
jgi:hypothetical protein